MEKYSEYLKRMKRNQVKAGCCGSSMDLLNKPSSSMEDEVLIWPPRSYSCSFCKREFRSAQALGGHMNVHRRDRAKLKQSNIKTTPVFPSHNNNIALAASPISSTIFSQENPGDHQKGCNGEMIQCSKRQRISSCNTVSFMPILHDPCLGSDKYSLRSEQLQVIAGIRSNNSMEEIDLELRVGGPPVVN